MDAPTPVQEVERKALEELERLTFAMQHRKITVEVAGQALTTLWNTVSGVVPKETMDIIARVHTAVQEKLKAPGQPSRRCMVLLKPISSRSSNGTVIVEWTGTGASLMRHCDDKPPVFKTFEADPSELFPHEIAYKKYKEWCDQLLPLFEQVRLC